MKKGFILLIAILIFLSVFWLLQNKNLNLMGQILAGFEAKKIIFIGQNKAEIKVEIADDERERARGLSGRDSLDENAGMLFVFDQPGFYGFWMKEMKFSLDFIWISGDKTVDLTENVLPPQSDLEDLQKYFSRDPADKVLEVNAGWIKKHNIKIGDEFSL
jgi:hypothetical protein